MAKQTWVIRLDFECDELMQGVVPLKTSIEVAGGHDTEDELTPANECVAKDMLSMIGMLIASGRTVGFSTMDEMVESIHESHDWEDTKDTGLQSKPEGANVHIQS